MWWVSQTNTWYVLVDRKHTCWVHLCVCACVFVYTPDIKPTTNSPRVSVATEIAFLRKKKKFTSSFLCTRLTHSALLDQRCVNTGWIEGTIWWGDTRSFHRGWLKMYGRRKKINQLKPKSKGGTKEGLGDQRLWGVDKGEQLKSETRTRGNLVWNRKRVCIRGHY